MFWRLLPDLSDTSERLGRQKRRTKTTGMASSLRWPSGPSDVGTCRATQFLRMQWSSKSMGNGYSMGLHHHPSLKHLHEFMYIDGEIVNTHIYHHCQLWIHHLYLYLYYTHIYRWEIYISFGFISLPLHLLAHRQLRRPFKEDHLNPSNVKHVLNMSQPINDLIGISYWGECIHYNLDLLCVYIHRSITAYIYNYT